MPPSSTILYLCRLANRCRQRQWQQWWWRIRQCGTVDSGGGIGGNNGNGGPGEESDNDGGRQQSAKREEMSDVLVNLCHARNRLEEIAMEATPSSIWRRK
jgi:hypothetical protein